eukprot:1148470-Pelagomonas_calceolata.AAC.5
MVKPGLGRTREMVRDAGFVCRDGVGNGLLFGDRVFVCRYGEAWTWTDQRTSEGWGEVDEQGECWGSGNRQSREKEMRRQGLRSRVTGAIDWLLRVPQTCQGACAVLAGFMRSCGRVHVR